VLSFEALQPTTASLITLMKWPWVLFTYVGFEFLTAVVMSSGIQRRVVRWKSADNSYEHIASNFRVEYATHDTQLATFHTGILLGLFDPEDGCDMFLRNVG
jgi:hypothetical protein